MHRPKVTLENYEAVYDFYRDYRQNEQLAKIGHFAMSTVFRPQFDIAEGAQEKITELLDNNTRLIIVSNHLLDTDQYAVAAMAHLVPSLHRLRGKTKIPTKQSLSKNPILRRGIDIMGSVPVNRGSDVYLPGKEVSEETRALRFAATQRYLTTMPQLITAGYHMASFPEGTRNDIHPRTLLDIKTGLGEIMSSVRSDIQLALLHVGLWYGEGEDKNVRRPSMYIPEPITGSFIDPLETTALIGSELQLSLDAAIKHFEQR